MAKASTIRLSSNASPTQLAISRARSESRRRVAPSTIAVTMWPPSSTGMGSRFISPRLTLMRAIWKRKTFSPASAASLAIWKSISVPPTFLKLIWKVAIL